MGKLKSEGIGMSNNQGIDQNQTFYWWLNPDLLLKLPKQ